jgi:hypothetical protein
MAGGVLQRPDVWVWRGEPGRARAHTQALNRGGQPARRVGWHWWAILALGLRSRSGGALVQQRSALNDVRPGRGAERRSTCRIEWAFSRSPDSVNQPNPTGSVWTPLCSSPSVPNVSQTRSRPKHPQASPRIPRISGMGPNGVVCVWNLLHGPTVCARQCRRASLDPWMCVPGGSGIVVERPSKGSRLLQAVAVGTSGSEGSSVPCRPIRGFIEPTFWAGRKRGPREVLRIIPSVFWRALTNKSRAGRDPSERWLAMVFRAAPPAISHLDRDGVTRG